MKIDRNVFNIPLLPKKEEKAKERRHHYLDFNFDGNV